MLDWLYNFFSHVWGFRAHVDPELLSIRYLMATSALKLISSQAYLEARFTEMYQNVTSKKREGSGVDGISLNDFNSDLTNNIRKLRSSLIKGEYKPKELLPYFVPKPDGKERIICVPTVNDRLVQRSILHYLNSKGYTLKNSVSYGFVLGGGIHDASRKAIEHRNTLGWVYKADISAFFDEINRVDLKKTIKKKVKARSLHELLCLSVDTEVKALNSSDKKKLSKRGIEVGRGLRQGMPISPYLANLYLDSFDKTIIQAGIPMVRYADDIIAFASDESSARQLHETCKNLTESVGLRLHDLDSDDKSKTSISSPSETVEFLGLGFEQSPVGYQLVVTKGQLNHIKQKLYEVANIDYCLKNGITVSKLLSRLDAKIRGYEVAYASCSNKVKLSDSLHSFRIESVRRVFDNFGINVDQLTKKQKMFFEIYNKK